MMRPDLNKVLTEQPRRGSNSRNLKTRATFRDYDGGREDRYSLPKRGKLVMHNRELGPWNEDKDFTDSLGPLKRWLKSKVGRNWNSLYSEIRRTFPNTNKQNSHLIETHLLGYLYRDVVVEKMRKGRRVFVISRFAGKQELCLGELYIDPQTNVLMQYKRVPERHPQELA